MSRRWLWKTIHFRNPNDFYSLQSAWGSSWAAFGAGKVMEFAGGHILEVETNLSKRDLAALARHAGVSIPWRNGVVYDDRPSWHDNADAYATLGQQTRAILEGK